MGTGSVAQLAVSSVFTMNVPPLRSARKRILSPALTLSSMAGSPALKTMVIGGMSRLASGPWAMVILPAALSTFFTVPSDRAASAAMMAGAAVWWASSAEAGDRARRAARGRAKFIVEFRGGCPWTESSPAAPDHELTGSLHFCQTRRGRLDEPHFTTSHVGQVAAQPLPDGPGTVR